MIRHIFIILMLILFAGCGTDKESLPIADLDFDGLAQECFDSTARVRSSGSIGTASAIRYLIKKDSEYIETKNVLEASHVEYESNRHVCGDRGRNHVLDIWFEGDLVASQDCKTNESWFQDGVSKDLATIICSLSDLQGVPPVVSYAPYDSNPVAVGDKVFTIGCSDGRVPRARCSDVIRVEGDLIYYSPKSVPGDSGGGIYKFNPGRDAWEIVGRTAWAIKQGGEWVGLGMSSQRVWDIKSGRVSSKPFFLPEGAVQIDRQGTQLPAGAVTIDQVKAVSVQEELGEEPEALPVHTVNRKWRFPLRPKDIDGRKLLDREGKRSWNIFGGIADFFQSLIRFAFATAIIILIAVLYIAPTILTPLKYDWPWLFVKTILNTFRK
jgi:hypothetical protein